MDYTAAWNTNTAEVQESWQFTTCEIFNNVNLNWTGIPPAPTPLLHNNSDVSAKVEIVVVVIIITILLSKAVLWHVPQELSKWYDLRYIYYN